MKRTVAAFIIVLISATAALAGPRRYAFEEMELDNGLKVITLEDFSCPIVAVQVWYHVGSKDEDPERQGFAHMFEHMMFRGTDRLGPEEHFDHIRRVGGGCNAYTTFDQTVYVEELPRNQLELAFWLESERMAFLKIDNEGFDTERKVVEEERRLTLNRPYGTVPEKLLAEVFREHPYRWSTIGSIPHLRKATIDELQAFWDTFYVPNNATLVVVGAVKHAEVQGLAKKYFGWIPRCPQPPTITFREAEQKKARSVKLVEEIGQLPIVAVVYRSVPLRHPDQLPLGILMSVLGGGESSRLYVDAVKDQKIAQVALAGAFGLEQDGIMGAGGVLLPLVGKKKKLMQTIKRHLKGVMEEGITEAELNKVKNQLRRGEIEGTLTAAAKAGRLGRYAVLYGEADRINRRLAEIDAVTLDDVQRVAKTYLRKSRRLSVLIEPKTGDMLKSLFGGAYKEGTESSEEDGVKGENRVAKRTGPKAKAVRPEGFPTEPPTASLLDEFPEIPHTSAALPNGLRVVVVSNHEVPMVWLKLGLKSGAWTETHPGVAMTAMSLLTQGTSTRSSKELAEILESNAIRLSGSAGMDTATVFGSALLSQSDLAMALLADVVRNPTFPKDEFNILQNQMRMGMLVSTKTPEYLAEREFRRRLYGSHPYARTVSGELEDLDGLRLDDVKAWWRRHVRPDNAVMYVAGDITAPEAMKLVEKHLGGWRVEGTFAAPALAAMPDEQATRIYLVDRPGSVQSQIRVGHRGITRRDAHYAVSRVLSSILGGGFNSRLNKAIRIDRGLTYGARGGFRPRRFEGDLLISTFTKTASTAEALRVILDEIAKLRAAPPTDKELRDTQTYITGSFPGQRETPSATVNDLWMIDTQGLPEDYLRGFLAGIKGATAGAVKQASQALLDPEHLIIVVVGEADKIRESLEQIAPVTVLSKGTPEPDSAKDPGSKDTG